MSRTWYSGSEDVGQTWSGNSIQELAEKFPRYRDYRLDRLQPFTNDDMSQNFWFERWTESGWERINDPRPRVPAPVPYQLWRRRRW